MRTCFAAFIRGTAFPFFIYFFPGAGRQQDSSARADNTLYSGQKPHPPQDIFESLQAVQKRNITPSENVPCSIALLLPRWYDLQP